MRVVRGKVAVVVALVLAVGLVLSALAGLGASGSAPTSIPASGPWSISLSHPEGAWDACLNDPAIAEGVMSSDLPVSRVVANSAEDASEADVRRVLDCLSGALTGGTVEVGPAQPLGTLEG